MAHTFSAENGEHIRFSNKGISEIGSVSASVVSVDGHEPPDPTASDRNDGFTAPTVPSPATTTSNSWGVWSGYWVPNWVWVEDWNWEDDPDSPTGGHWHDDGGWVDKGKWNYDFNSYHATLSANMSLMPDSKDPSRQGKEMKSGYGVDITVNGDLCSNAPAAHVTAPQTGLTYFPEFKYQTYWRHLDCTPSGSSAAFQYMPNIYSTYSDRVHFTPLGFPDSKYTAYAALLEIFDAWLKETWKLQAGEITNEEYDTWRYTYQEWKTEP